MKNDDEIIQSLISGGFIGSTLNTLMIKYTQEGINLGSIASAAMLATFKAAQKARESNIPLFVEEDGILYQTQINGEKKFVRKIEKPAVKLKAHFKLK